MYSAPLYYFTLDLNIMFIIVFINQARATRLPQYPRGFCVVVVACVCIHVYIRVCVCVLVRACAFSASGTGEYEKPYVSGCIREQVRAPARGDGEPPLPH